jgi:D-tyrosyl-tRNA(Tyr) deacylase
MRVVVQRSKAAQVTVDHKVIGRIPFGLVVLVGVGQQDKEEDARYLAEKVAHLRLFEDDQGKMNRSVLEVGGAILSVSQFTLYGDCTRGRRPSFTQAAKPEWARLLYNRFNAYLKEYGLEVETGEFGAMMQVQLTNDGPVTLIIDSKER